MGCARVYEFGEAQLFNATQSLHGLALGNLPQNGIVRIGRGEFDKIVNWITNPFIFVHPRPHQFPRVHSIDAS